MKNATRISIAAGLLLAVGALFQNCSPVQFGAEQAVLPSKVQDQLSSDVDNNVQLDNSFSSAAPQVPETTPQGFQDNMIVGSYVVGPLSSVAYDQEMKGDLTFQGMYRVWAARSGDARARELLQMHCKQASSSLQGVCGCPVGTRTIVTNQITLPVSQGSSVQIPAYSTEICVRDTFRDSMITGTYVIGGLSSLVYDQEAKNDLSFQGIRRVWTARHGETKAKEFMQIICKQTNSALQGICGCPTGSKPVVAGVIMLPVSQGSSVLIPNFSAEVCVR